MDFKVDNANGQINPQEVPSADNSGIEVIDMSNGGSPAVTETGVTDSGNPDALNPSGAAAQTTTQQQINKAIGQRLYAERAKFKPDIDLSKNIRNLYAGMSDEDIVAKLTGLAANDYAAQRDIPVPVAEEVLSLRMQKNKAPDPEPETPVTPDIQAIAAEANAIEKKYGINIVQMIASSPELQERVFGKGESLNDILIEHLQSSVPQSKPFVPIASANGSGSGNQSMTDAQYRAITNALKQGRKVRI